MSKKNWRIVKVEYIEAKLTLREAMQKKRELNLTRNNTEKWKFYYRIERMEEWDTI